MDCKTVSGYNGLVREPVDQNFLDRKAEEMRSAQELSLFIETNQARFYRVAYTYVKNREDALDIVHNAIVNALKSYATLRSPEYAQTWFYRILINESISFLRKKRPAVSLEELSAPQLQPAAAASEAVRDEYLDLYTAVDKLSPDLRAIVILRFFEDMKLDEIAEITATNLNTVKSKLYRALRQLKLEMEGFDHD